MEPVSIYEARNNLSRLIEAAMAGEEVVLTKRGEPVVRIVRLDDAATSTESALDFLNRVRPWEWTQSRPEELDAWILKLREDWD